MGKLSKKFTNKKIYLEILRLICIFFVLFNHISPEGYLAFIGEENAVLYFIYMFFSVLCKVAVPIFFMISGALLLGKDEPISVLFKKRILRMLVVLILISIPYYLWLSGDSPKSVGGFFRTIYTDVASTGLWYLYLYIGFLIMLPFIRAMVRSMKKNAYLYLIAVQIFLSLFFTVMDKFVFTDGRNSFFAIALILETNIFYPVVGYFIENVLEEEKFNKKNKWISLVLIILSVIITCVISAAYYKVRGCELTISIAESCFWTLISVPAMAIFFLFKGIVKIKPDQKLGQALCILGEAVFGVYLIEKVCRTIAAPVYVLLNPFLGNFLAAVVMALTAMVIGLIIICLLKNIPYVRNVVNKFI